VCFTKEFVLKDQRRCSTLNIDESNFLPKVHQSTFTESEEAECLAEVRKAMLDCKTPKDVAKNLKQFYDTKDPGRSWHCLVGQHYAASISYSASRVFFFNLGKYNVLLFQTQ